MDSEMEDRLTGSSTNSEGNPLNYVDIVNIISELRDWEGS